MYINWFTWIIFSDDPMCYMAKSGVMRIFQLSKRNGKSQFTTEKQGNYLLITIYAVTYVTIIFSAVYITLRDKIKQVHI